MSDILVLRHRVVWTQVLADLRAAGVSGHRLAAIMNISRSTVQHWESGGEPSHSYGAAILEVHRRFCGEHCTDLRIHQSELVT